MLCPAPALNFNSIFHNALKKLGFLNNTFAKIKISARKWLTPPPETGFFQKTRFLIPFPKSRATVEKI